MSKCFAAAFAVVLMATNAMATGEVLFSEGFDSDAANVKVNQSPDSAVEFVDYSNFTVGATNFSIPEAPKMVAGSAATKGILVTVNQGDDVAAAEAVNILAGLDPIAFSGNYLVNFDVYMSTHTGSGTTEQALYGVGTNDDDTLEAAQNRNNDGTGLAKGTWGWITGENGAGTEDFAVNIDDVELADIGDGNVADATYAPQLFNTAFEETSLETTNNSAALQWVSVAVQVYDGEVSVALNNTQFFPNAKGNPDVTFTTDGFAMLGYEDRFSSISDPADLTWAVFDNFTVRAIPEPSSVVLLLMGCCGLVRRRR